MTGQDGPNLIVDVPGLGPLHALARPGVVAGQSVTLALRPQKLGISRERPTGQNVFAGQVEGLAYFGKDSLYRVTLPDGRVISVNSVNARRAGEHARVADWEDAVWLTFDPSAAIILTD